MLPRIFHDVPRCGAIEDGTAPYLDGLECGCRRWELSHIEGEARVLRGSVRSAAAISSADINTQVPSDYFAANN